MREEGGEATDRGREDGGGRNRPLVTLIPLKTYFNHKTRHILKQIKFKQDYWFMQENFGQGSHRCFLVCLTGEESHGRFLMDESSAIH